MQVGDIAGVEPCAQGIMAQCAGGEESEAADEAKEAALVVEAEFDHLFGRRRG